MKETMPSKERISTLCFGLGTIGKGALSRALEDPRLIVVGAVDLDSQLHGKNMGRWLGEDPSTFQISKTLSEALAQASEPPRVAIHATGSRVAQVYDQLNELVSAGIAVSTSCEEMLYPWRAAPTQAQALDTSARDSNVCIYPTGVNPGYVLDRLPASLARTTSNITYIRATRRVDSFTRRPQLRIKTGAGMQREQFEELASKGKIGHIGLAESLHFLAEQLGSPIAKFDHLLSPVVASQDLSTKTQQIKKGQVTGAREEIHATLSSGTKIELALEIAAGTKNPMDCIEIQGDPPSRLEIPGGLPGEASTMGALINGAALASRLPPGLARS